MRKAKIDHAWTGCRVRPSETLSIDQITLRKNASDVPLGVASRVTAIVGRNGAGKSGLLRSIRSILAGLASESRPEVLAISGKFRGAEFRASEGVASGVTVDLVDVSEEVHKVEAYAKSQEGFEELLAQSGGRVVSPSHTGSYRYMTGINYEKITAYELERPVNSVDASKLDDDDVFPFFQVEVDGYSYDSRSMGFGEHCAFYLTWLTFRAERGSILLLDEPDAHLSAPFRRAMLNMFAVAAHARELWICFSSHAMEAIESLRESEINLVRSEGRIADVCVVAGKRQIMRDLGLVPYGRLLIVVEDVDAVEAVNLVVKRRMPELSSSVEIRVVSGGANQVVRFVEAFPGDMRSFGIVAVLDGDKRAEYLDRPKVLFLPGTTDPMFSAKAAAEAQPAQIAEALGVDPASMARTVAKLQYMEHHDYCAELYAEYGDVGSGIASVRSALLKTWLNLVEVEADVTALADSLRARVNTL